MRESYKNRGFSLTEVLLSVGILAVGMIFVAGVFPVGIHFTTIATERTIAAIVADEAFAKIKIYAKDNPAGGIDFGVGGIETNQLKDFNDVLETGVEIDPNEFVYPSTGTGAAKQYCWSALCRRVDSTTPLVQVTVFVSRKVGSHLEYPDPNVGGVVDWPTPPTGNWPVPVKVEVSNGSGDNELKIDNYYERSFINDGYMIVDNQTGDIYRVLERYRDDPGTAEREDKVILLDRDWEGSNEVWVVPPPVNGNRYPCIGIYQKVIRF